jgi:GR25 family glycosyltransferase involved in LPS biosynthesis
MIERKFYINLVDDYKRRVKFLDGTWHRWDACSREEVPDELDKKMISMHNYPRQAHLGRCGCMMSHYELYVYIVENQLNNCLICEDDAVQVKDLPTEYPTDGITYVGGFLHPKKMMSKEKVNIKSKEGINYVNLKYRVLMTMSYIIPTWEVAKEILELIDMKTRYRAIDIMLGNMAINKYYEFPACFIEEGSDSTIAKKQKRSNEFYRWVKI